MSRRFKLVPQERGNLSHQCEHVSNLITKKWKFKLFNTMSYHYTWTTVSNRYKRWRDRITPTFWRRRKRTEGGFNHGSCLHVEATSTLGPASFYTPGRWWTPTPWDRICWSLDPSIPHPRYLLTCILHHVLYYVVTWQRAPLVVQMVKIPPANAGDVSSIPGLGRFPGGENSNPLQHSCLRNPMDRGAWWAIVHGGLRRVRHDLATKQQPDKDKLNVSLSSWSCSSTWLNARMQLWEPLICSQAKQKVG